MPTDTTNSNIARCRTGTDLMTLFYTFDEYSDVEDKAVTRQMADILMDAIRNPDKPRPQGECCLGEMTRQFVLPFPRAGHSDRQ
jgi:Delta6-protoilludene synthase